MTAVVVVTVFNDARVVKCIKSILEGTRVPDRILVADGGSTDGTWELVNKITDPRVECKLLPGSVAETRAQVVPLVDERIIVFLDADEIATPEWFEQIIRPIENGDADVVGAPTRPAKEAKTSAQAYVDSFDEWFYENVVSKDQTRLPMGNAAFRVGAVREAGGFDERLRWGGEDYDLNIRLLMQGAKFVYLPDAWVYHDQSHLDTRRKLWGRMRRYSKGAMVAYMKNKSLRKQTRGVVSSTRPFRWMDWYLLIAKGVGALEGWFAWRRIR